jgi:protein gp37
LSTTTEIEWTDKTWNPTTGCDRVSPGCGLPLDDGTEHGDCYALTLAKRLKGMGSAKYQNDGDPVTSGPGFLATEHESELDAPLRWRKPAMVFVNSMSDLFHERISDEFIAKVFAVMALAKQHTFQVLTKRHGRMRALLRSAYFFHAVSKVWSDPPPDWPLPRDWAIPLWPLPNVWIGVSVEDQKRADLRIPKLLDTPAAVRFLSCEPLLGTVDLSGWMGSERRCDGVEFPWIGTTSTTSRAHTFDCCTPCPIDWVIAGGESGPGALAPDPAWIRLLRDQCQQSGTAFLFKQWGGIRPKAGGRVLDGRTWDEFPGGAR